MKKLFRRLWHRFAESRRRQAPFEVSLTLDGFVVWRGGKMEYSVRWQQIDEIRAWKVDRYVHDEIVISFRVPALGGYYKLPESSIGFAALVNEMQRRCPPRDPNWVHAVAVPAFKANETVVWQRSSVVRTRSTDRP